jgi:feruloyl esterase
MNRHLPRLTQAVAFVGTLAFASAGGARAQGYAPSQHAADHGDCARLTQLSLPDVKITEAVVVPASTGPLKVAHCRVGGVIGTEIKFSLLLPDDWNHKFVMGGGGGFVGSVQNQAQSSIKAGYATAGTDTGHTGGMVDARWALHNIPRQLSYAYLGVHRTALVAKDILRAYYGSNETRSYFSGCSNGGRQALMEAQRYPDDFDGIVAGAPAADFTGIGAQFIKDTRAQFPDSKNLTTLLPPETMRTVAAQILNACDALDGVKDGVLDDPRRCKVDVATFTGLSAAQQTALKAIYGPTIVRGETVLPGQPFGGEGEMAGWPKWISGAVPRPAQASSASLRYNFGTQLFKFFVFDDPDWDYSKYDLSTFRADTKRLASILNATNADLSPFKARGHKLLIWHGWADAGLTPLATIKYYDAIKALDPKADEFVRMFMMPGVLHCEGGAGPDNVDWTAVIDAWLDGGRAPDRIVARKLAGTTVTRSRPLCAYPRHAEYAGSGSTDDERSFRCR